MKIQQERFDNVNYIDLQHLYLHDAELGLVTVNYKDQVTTVKLCYAGYYDATILFSKVKHVDVTIDEPWGGGIYVSSVETNKLNGDFKASILLNSGDEITVVAEEVTIEGYEDPRPRLPK